jgi:hypothetical protein
VLLRILIDWYIETPFYQQRDLKKNAQSKGPVTRPAIILICRKQLSKMVRGKPLQLGSHTMDPPLARFQPMKMIAFMANQAVEKRT